MRVSIWNIDRNKPDAIFFSLLTGRKWLWDIWVSENHWSHRSTFSICPLFLSSYFLTISRIKSSFYCSQNASQETGNWVSLSCFLRLIYFKIDWRYLVLISYKSRWHSKAVFKHIPWQEGCLSSLDSPSQFYHWIISKDIPYSSFIQNFHNCCTLSI